MARTYVISDLHLGHKLMAKLRGFDSVHEHNKTFRRAWFDTVSSNDVVYVLGDVLFNLPALYDFQNWPGAKKLIYGNHDRISAKRLLEVFKSLKGYQVIDHTVLLSHIPIHPTSMTYRYRLNIHGHTHSKGSPQSYAYGSYYSVCPEIIGNAPILLDDILKLYPRSKANNG